MRKRTAFRAFASLALLTISGVARAQCVPLISPISQPGTFPNFMAGPVASNGSVIGLARSDAQSGTPSILFATYDANLNRVTADRQVAASSVNGPVALLWNGTEFGVFYQQTDYTLILHRVDANGNLIGSPITIANHPWAGGDEFDIIWSATHNAYAIVRTVTIGPDNGLWLTLFSKSGAVVTDTQVSIFPANPAVPRLAALPNGNFGVTWLRQSTSAPLFLSMVASGAILKSVSVSDHNVIGARVATDGTKILVIYSSTVVMGMTTGTELRSSEFDLAGNRLTSDAPFLAGVGSDILPLSLQWNPTLGEWALVYNDAALGLGTIFQIRLRRFSSLDAVASDTTLSPDPLRTSLNAPYPIVFMNGAYYASIQRVNSRVEGSESYLVKLCPFFATATSSGGAQPFTPVTFTASASGGTPPYTFEWNFGDNGLGTGATAQHLYSAPGTYTVTLTGRDAFGALSVTTTTVMIANGKHRAVRH